MELALFDFDGTITDRDTMLAYCKHVRGPIRFWLGMLWLTPVFVAMTLKVLPNEKAKVLFLRHFLGGMKRADLEAAAVSFATHIDAWVRPGADARIGWHKEQGHELAVVSASLDLWLMPWMRQRGLRCLCSQAAWEGDTFTGSLAGENCNHEQKVVRIREAFGLDQYTRVHAYGDSGGDRAMLGIADEAHFKPFRDA